MIRKAVIFSACLLLNLTIVSNVKADEIVVEVSGNSAGSNNEVHVQSQNNNTVTQNNDSNINNNVSTNANTGNNSANANNGDAGIQTGNVQANTTVSNQNVNSNSITDNSCNCSQTTGIEVSGNGSKTENDVYVKNGSSTSLSQTNNARISNNVNVDANTGYNKASFNSGSATIITGNIKAKTNVINKNINNSFGSIDSASGNSAVIISDNAAESENTVFLDESNTITTDVINIAQIVNNIDHVLNTGGNETLKNLGDSAIVTGDIDSEINVENTNINSSVVDIDCQCSQNPPTTPSEHQNPPSPSGGTSIVQGASGSAGSSGGSSGTSLPRTGLTLPVTLIATIIFFFMFLAGLYLRFSSSKAPPAIA